MNSGWMPICGSWTIAPETESRLAPSLGEFNSFDRIDRVHLLKKADGREPRECAASPFQSIELLSAARRDPVEWKETQL